MVTVSAGTSAAIAGSTTPVMIKRGKAQIPTMKGKIPIITKCSQCPYKSLWPCDKPHCRCRLTDRDIEESIARANIPDWCPLPDIDKLLELLERKGTITNEGNLMSGGK